MCILFFELKKKRFFTDDGFVLRGYLFGSV